MVFAKHWYSAKKTNWIAQRAGTKHGKAGIEPLIDQVIGARLGQAVPFDAVNNPEHAELARRAAPHPQLAEWTLGVQQAEKALAKYPRRSVLWVGFLVFLGIEYAGTYELLKGQGMEEPNVTIVALAASCILFYLAHLASKGSK